MQFAWHHQPSEQDGKLSLIHIPLDLFPYFVQPVLQLLLGEETPPQRSDRRDTSTLSGPNVRGKDRIGFANISITPVELSVVCPVQLVKTYFEPVLDSLDQATRNKVSISKDDFVAICVEGEGVMDAGQRMLELTGPLAMAGMYVLPYSIFPVCLLTGAAPFSSSQRTGLISCWCRSNPRLRSQRHSKSKGLLLLAMPLRAATSVTIRRLRPPTILYLPRPHPRAASVSYRRGLLPG